MRLFWEYFKIGFKSNTVYRINYLIGLVSAFIQLFITRAIWIALYNGNEAVNGISFGMLTTSFVISIGLENAFGCDDFAVANKMYDGSIAMEFIKPIDYRFSLFANEVGNIAFKLITNFLPILIISIIVVGIVPPVGVLAFGCFIVSIVLGFFILWSISYIVKMTTFWIMNVWSVSALKGVLISVFSGIALPIWFLPDYMKTIVHYTPFESIYFSPIQIYLGNINGMEILFIFGKQLLWAAILFAIGNVMWLAGRKRIIVQGG